MTADSIGAATVDSITSELAPGYVADTITCGGVIVGYCSNGRFFRAIKPARVITSEITMANLGLSIKNFENIL